MSVSKVYNITVTLSPNANGVSVTGVASTVKQVVAVGFLTGPAGPGVAIGGTSGQVLAKDSSTDYDTHWVDAASGTVTSVSSADGNATVVNPTTTPAITIVSAPKLTTARNINGVSFDGTADVTVADSTKVPTTTTVNGHVLSANVTVSASDVGLGSVDNTSDANKPVSTAQAAADALNVLKAGDTMTGTLGMSGNQIYSLADGINSDHAVNKGQLDTKLPLAGGTMTGSLTIQGTAAANVATFKTSAGTITQYINASGSYVSSNIFPSASNTWSLGITSAYYSNVYASRLNLNSTAYIDGATAGRISVTGTLNVLSTLTFPSTATGIALYNTSDQTTNYERVRQYWSGSTYIIGSEAGGTGTVRSIQLATSSGTSLNINNSGSSNGYIQLVSGKNISDSGIDAVTTQPTLTNSSGTNSILKIAPTISQTSTAGYTALLINPTETATGSGANTLVDAQVGGVSKFKVDNAGRVTINGADRITGTGSPSGVVVAPVGSIYIDTAVTNGASSWIKKSGTDNTGWQVLEGDTGWRNVTSLLINGWTATSVLVRRTTYGLDVAIENLLAASSTGAQVLALPVGFRSGVLLSRLFLTTATGPASVYRLTLNDGGSLAMQNYSTSIPGLYGLLPGVPETTWPTTLPGTLA